MGRSLASLDRVGIDRLKGVGVAKQTAAGLLGIHTVLDLLTHYPRRYVDRTAQAAIGEMTVGEQATVLATVRRVSSRRTRAGRALVEVDVFDGTGYLGVTFFNQSWRAKQLAMGRQALFFGRLEVFKGRRRMTNPLVDLVDGDADGASRTGRVVPIYPQSEKADLTSWELGSWVRESLERAGELADPVPPEHLEHLGLVDRTTAMHQIHMPETLEAKDQARRRLAFDELLRLQIEVVGRKRAVERGARGIQHAVGAHGGASVATEADGVLARFRRNLPFSLTGSQEAALAEILGDLAGPYPMHRLLQGEVGSGKTVVAVAALLVAVAGGHQGALMAPTEVLADQHYLGVRDLVTGLIVADPDTLAGERPVRVELFTGRNTASERARLSAELAAGRIDLAIGTHALLTESVGFCSLGVVVIDEQHRFGVEQRAVLRSKGQLSVGGFDPDVLVMTATPIPRTAAMTVFGDLDVSVMTERPPGRTAVSTAWARDPIEVAAAWERVRQEVAAGHRAYVVCPLVEGSERIEAASAVEEATRLATDELEGLRLGLLHGQLPAKDKEAVMGDFRAGRLDVLVATTVIEVGVDVPDATVMVVEDAARFGMAQLHQLRGRVGRGGSASWCYLLGEPTTPEGAERLTALEAHDDGFELAEIDLDLRGEGTILGARQQGRSDLKLASLREDRELVSAAREVAFALVDAPGGLGAHPGLAEEVALFLGAEEADFLLKS